MRVNVTLACTECGDRNYISTKTKELILNVLKWKNIVHVIINTLYTVKLNNNSSKEFVSKIIL